MSHGACAVRAPQVFGVRAMLAVPYLEKALYEMPEEQLSPQALVELADRVEAQVGASIMYSEAVHKYRNGC